MLDRLKSNVVAMLVVIAGAGTVADYYAGLDTVDQDQFVADMEQAATDHPHLASVVERLCDSCTIPYDCYIVGEDDHGGGKLTHRICDHGYLRAMGESGETACTPDTEVDEGIPCGAPSVGFLEEMRAVLAANVEEDIAKFYQTELDRIQAP